MTEAICQKHKQVVAYICAVEGCLNMKICEECKIKQTLHFTQHVNFIVPTKQFHTFCTSQQMIPKLQSGINGSERLIHEHRKFYQDQIKCFNKDFDALIDQFKEVAEGFRKIYLETFQKQMNSFDQQLIGIKNLLKDYKTERSQQQSFFNFIFGDKNQNSQVEDLMKKHWKVFKVRANIIILRSNITISSTNKTSYKGTPQLNHRFEDIKSHIKDLSISVFNQMSDLLVNQGNATVKSTISTESRIMANPLSQSQVSIMKKLSQSQVSLGKHSLSSRDFHSSRVVELVRIKSMPAPHPETLKIMQLLKPLQYPPGLLVLQDKQTREKGIFQYENGCYSGQILNGLRSGKGSFVFKDGSHYQGTWQDDNMSGYGRLITTNSYYEGGIINGKANGTGTFENSHWIYMGQWRNDKRHGNGEWRPKPITAECGYHGSFLNDLFHGHGVLQTKEFLYQGSFIEGNFDGQGIVLYHTDPKEVQFKGIFHEGQRKKGYLKYRDGSYFEGQFQANLPHGSGIFRWVDGTLFVGHWQFGVQQGEGYQTEDGRKLRGLWKGGNWIRWL